MEVQLERRRILIAAALFAGTASVGGVARAVCAGSRDRWPREGELVGGNERDLILSVARKMMVKVGHAALVTIDDGGMPRVRSVDTSDPEDDLRVWIATNPASRKIEQIRARPEVALHYVEIENMASVTLMGLATLHDEVETKRAKNFHSEEQLRQHWPGFPDDYALISVAPLWLEIVAPHTRLQGDPATWRPAGLEL
jgi:general stress protein 26